MAYQLKSDVDAAYVRLADRLLTEGIYPAVATHDESIIDEVKRSPPTVISPDAFEFQMLYGIRRDLQQRFATPATACASSCRSAGSGFRTSCADLASVRRMWHSCSGLHRRALS